MSDILKDFIIPPTGGTIIDIDSAITPSTIKSSGLAGNVFASSKKKKPPTKVSTAPAPIPVASLDHIWIGKAVVEKLKEKLNALKIPFAKEDKAMDLRLKLSRYLFAQEKLSPDLIPLVAVTNEQEQPTENIGEEEGDNQDDITLEDEEAEKEDGEEDNDLISFGLEMPANLRNLTSDIHFHEQPFPKSKVVAIKRTYQAYKGVPTRAPVQGIKDLISSSNRTSTMDKKLQAIQNSTYLSFRPLLYLADAYRVEANSEEGRVWKLALETVANTCAIINALRRDELMFNKGPPTKVDPEIIPLISDEYLADMKRETKIRKIFNASKRSSEGSSMPHAKRFKSNNSRPFAFPKFNSSSNNNNNSHSGNNNSFRGRSKFPSSFSRPAYSSNYRGSNPNPSFARKDNYRG
jgi:hypothetical protein